MKKSRELWEQFEQSGRLSDYLLYCAHKKALADKDSVTNPGYIQAP